MSILNYQGNKYKLISYIDSYMYDYIQKDKALLDIFSGGGAICNYYYNKIPVYANDLEKYSSIIADSILNTSEFQFDNEWKKDFINDFYKNYNFIAEAYIKEITLENYYIKNDLSDELIELYNEFPTLWNGKYSKLVGENLEWGKIDFSEKYILMTVLYSSNYFGIKQAIELDSLRFAIEKTNSKYNVSYLMSALFYSMNNCVFSKDGHMAQPLNMKTNRKRLLKVRKESVFDLFIAFVDKYQKDAAIFNNKVLNYDIQEFLEKQTSILQDVGCIYADPPYTDMQYSRYYHLLNTISYYNADCPTIKNGKYTSGLYLNNRNQSVLSTKKNCLITLKKLMKTCKEKRINLVISFAYPEDNSFEKNDRYVMNISDLINASADIFGDDYVEVHKMDYLHSNHRNSKKKRVIEYLICCRGYYD